MNILDKDFILNIHMISIKILFQYL